MTVMGIPLDQQPLTVKQFAAKHGKTYNHALFLLKAGKVDGAFNARRNWFIPRDASWPEGEKPGRKPKDA